MRILFTKRSVLLLLLLGLMLASGCMGPKPRLAVPLPEGFASALVPNLPLDGYFYARQPQLTALPFELRGLPLKGITIQSVALWLVPSGAAETIGVGLALPTAQVAEAVFGAIPPLPDLWKQLSDTNLFIVWGRGDGAEQLRKTIEARNFVPLAQAAPDAWDLVQFLPGAAATKPWAVGFLRAEDRLFAFLQKFGPAADPRAATALNMAGIKIAVGALYANRVLQAADFVSPAALWEAGVGGILVARSAYPEMVISTALGTLASRFSLEKTSLEGKTVFYRAVPRGGEKAHFLISNSGSYIYVSAAAELARSQQLHRWTQGAN